MKIVTLAGGVGGARMARGFAVLDTVELTVVVNVGDDDTIYGVELSPDIDTVVYMLAGVEGQFGWGRSDDTWQVMSELERFDIDTSFRLGDQDLALNLFRTHLLRKGIPLSSITRAQCSAFDIATLILPATDDRVRTKVQVADAGPGSTSRRISSRGGIRIGSRRSRTTESMPLHRLPVCWMRSSKRTPS